MVHRIVLKVLAALISFVVLIDLRPAHAAPTDVEDRCAAMVKVDLPDAKVDAATLDRGVCKLHGTIKPTPSSNIHFDVLLPVSDWSGRIQMIGNGGYSSQINSDQLLRLAQAGDVAVATDTGHDGNGLEFGFDNDDAIADWGYRAVHRAILVGKDLTAAFYGKPASHAYFTGCSTGGHQGLMEAERYPEDFDGILAGAPGNNRTNLNFGFLWQFLANHADGDNTHPLLSTDDLKLVNQAVMAKCDALDGVRDGIITDVRRCRFDPAGLRCKQGQNTSCLSDAQIVALKKMYAGPRRSDTGQSIYPGWPLGSEWIEGGGGWQLYWANPQKTNEPQRVDFFRQWVFHDPGWNWWTFDWSKGVDTAHRRMGPLVDAVTADLSAFRKHGGKLILYQGTADPVVSATDTIAYYQRMARRSPGTPSFARLFLVPGMAHCMGGPGATSFLAGADAEHDAGLAVRRWVEQNQAPDHIIAVKPTANGIAMSRPLCVWPKLPTYKGRGNDNEATSFACR